MPQFVRVGTDGFHFMLGEEIYVPIGFNYFPTGSGWAPQIWENPRPDVWNSDFERLSSLGTNTVRVFVSLKRLVPEDGIVSEEALDNLGRMLDAAESHGIRVIFSGPNSWEGWPEWFEVIKKEIGYNPYFSDERVLKNLELFYREFSKKFRMHEGLFGIDLLNEPEFPFDPAMADADHDTLWAYQQKRIAGSREFVRRMVAAIKSEDQNHLVSIGSHQYTIPLNSLSPSTFYGFDPHDIGDLVDYLSFHWYSYCDPDHKIYEGDEASYQWNLAQLLATARYMNVGKPVMYEEFALYGGNEFHRGWWQLPYLSQHTQARWMTDVMFRGKAFFTGIIHWGFQDHPCCGDPTRYQGLYDDDGNPKELAVIYPTLVELTRKWLSHNTPKPGPRTFVIDREKQLTSAEEMLRIREEAIRKAMTGEDFLFAVK